MKDLKESKIISYLRNLHLKLSHRIMPIIIQKIRNKGRFFDTRVKNQFCLFS